MAKIHDLGYGDELVPDLPLHDYLLQIMEQNKKHTFLTNATIATSYSYGDMIRQCKNLCLGLQGLGAQKGDVISLYGYNSAQFVTMVIASLMAGMTVNTCNPVATPHELKYFFKLVEPKMIFCELELLKNVEAACQAIGKKPQIILRERRPGYQDFNNLCLRRPGQVTPTSISFDVRNDVAFILFSSGTTGLPKGVMLTHHNVVSHIALYPAIFNSQVGENARVLSIFPLYHAAGLFGLFHTIKNGHRRIILEKYNLKLLLNSIQRYKPRVLTIPPTVIVQLAKTPLLSHYDISSVTECTTGAAPVKSATENAFKLRFNNCPIANGYGMTESVAGVVYKTCFPEDQQHPGSSGRITVGTMIKIIEPNTGEVLGPNHRGEVLIKSPRVMKGYLKNEKATRETIDQHGWLHTGDVAYFDDDGYIYIVDRLKELIKYKGNQVAPAELEALLLENDDVVDAGVVGVPDTEAGELPRAYIVKRENSGLTEQLIINYVKDRVSHYKQLRGGVVFLQEIPKTPSGKIIRRKLRELNKAASKL